MLIAITYDIKLSSPADLKRLLKIERICSNYGLRKQKSLFEFWLSKKDYESLKQELLSLIENEDSLRIYHLNRQQKVESFGKEDNLNFFESFIV